MSTTCSRPILHVSSGDPQTTVKSPDESPTIIDLDESVPSSMAQAKQRGRPPHRVPLPQIPRITQNVSASPSISSSPNVTPEPSVPANSMEFTLDTAATPMQIASLPSFPDHTDLKPAQKRGRTPTNTKASPTPSTTQMEPEPTSATLPAPSPASVAPPTSKHQEKTWAELIVPQRSSAQMISKTQLTGQQTILHANPHTQALARRKFHDADLEVENYSLLFSWQEYRSHIVARFLEFNLEQQQQSLIAHRLSLGPHKSINLKKLDEKEQKKEKERREREEKEREDKERRKQKEEKRTKRKEKASESTSKKSSAKRQRSTAATPSEAAVPAE